MAVLLRHPDGHIEAFANDQIPTAVAAGYLPPDDIQVNDAQGRQTTVPYDYYRDQASQGRMSAVDEGTIQDQVNRANLESETSTLGAGVRGFGEELSFGLYHPDDRQLQADTEFHPYARGAGRVVGAVAPALIPGVGEGKIAQLLGRGAVEGAELARGGSIVNDLSHLLPGRLSAGLARNATEAVGGGIRGMALGGAVEAGSSYTLRAALDRDVDFSAEGLVGSMALGGGLGAGIGAIGKAVSAVERRIANGAARAVEDGIDDVKRVSAIESNKAVKLSADELAHGDDIFRSATRDIPGYQAGRNVARDTDVLRREIGTWRQSALGRAIPVEDAVAIDRGLQSATYINKYIRQPTAVQSTVMGRFNQHLSDVDEMVGRVLKQPNRGGLDISRLPSAYSPVGLSARAEQLGRIDATGLTNVELAAKQLGTRLTAGRDAATNGLREGIVSNLLGHVPIVGKMLKGAAGGTGNPLGAFLGYELLDHAIEHGVLGVGLKGAVAIGVAKGIRKLSEHPATAGVIAGLSAESIRTLTGNSGTAPGGDRRKMARTFIDRSRALSPDDASRIAMQQASGIGHVSPDVLASIGAAASRRQALILRGLDRIDPPGQSAVQLSRRPLTSAQVRQVDDVVRIASSPVAFARMLAGDRLSSESLGLATQMWPATVNRAKSLSAAWLSKHVSDGNDVPRSIARRLELLLGRDAVGAQHDDSALAAQASIASARQRMQKPPVMPQPSGGEPSTALMAPSDTVSSRPKG